ncbi:hypothetical protein [Paraglaciecola hydrolytica]|uniref:Capsular biosynthesis protein n=1 Tax=Paraglaciecola hydrolytica TaxID=1799789 RepID=A0A135ZZV5_9ALTE|nr:hypothetical protein [Paraglaciecola hydrolytica]KXI28505.1 hypothetical protein AX660_15555 [Paraglaciecola hydrolytica]
MSKKNNIVILFWFYKEIPLCQERLEHFKKLNPDMPIYGLYGGEKSKLGELDEIATYMEHLYVFEKEASAKWKWLNGDQMLVDWYRQIGGTFSWDRVFILQWDLIMYQPLDYFIGDVKANQFIIPGVRNIKNVQAWWPNFEENRINEFRSYLKDNFNYEGIISCSLFICALLPREFFEYYKNREYPEAYFLEYKIPTVLNALGFESYDAPCFKPYWAKELVKDYVSVENRTLIARKRYPCVI